MDHIVGYHCCWCKLWNILITSLIIVREELKHGTNLETQCFLKLFVTKQSDWAVFFNASHYCNWFWTSYFVRYMRVKFVSVLVLEPLMLGVGQTSYLGSVSCLDVILFIIIIICIIIIECIIIIICILYNKNSYVCYEVSDIISKY